MSGRSIALVIAIVGMVPVALHLGAEKQVEQTTSGNAAVETSGSALLQKSKHMVNKAFAVGEDGAGQNKVFSSDSGKAVKTKALVSDNEKSQKKTNSQKKKTAPVALVSNKKNLQRKKVFVSN